MRSEAPSEKKLHQAMKARDSVESAIKGGLVGAAAGALKGRAAPGAALGALIGHGVGRLRGSERTLRDITAQERQQMRRDERTKKSEAETVFDGFHQELSKEAFAQLAGLAARAAPMVSGLGSRMIGLGARASKAVGQGQAFGNVMRQGATALGGGKAGGQALARTVGAGTLAAGGLAAAGGAGYLAGRAA